MQHSLYFSLWLLYIGLFFSIFTTRAQVIAWDKTAGSYRGDELRSAIATTDGGYLLSGYSSSPASGHKSENSKGGMDYWIVKIDAHGNVLWDKTVGGNSDDYLYSAISAADGGYLLAGYSNSPASGDKTENSNTDCDTPGTCNNDYWIVKIDAYGNVLWDKTIGSADADYLRSAILTNDGGYLLSGYSGTPASGDKSEGSRGKLDYWVVKIDAQGNIVWDKTVGGSHYDFLDNAIATTDGGYLLSGYSSSPASGDKTEDRRGGCDNFGDCDFDYWIVKLGESGNKLWDKTLGGSGGDIPRDAVSTTDGGYLLVGSSFSDASGDKTENRKGSYSDYWIIKVDGQGNKLWDKTLGGSGDDQMSAVISTTEGYLLSGYSSSPASGHKSENSKGGMDYWIVKIDAHGNVLWDKTVGGNSDDYLYSAISAADGYLLAGSSLSNAVADKSENHQGEIGYADYWIVKVEETATEFSIQSLALVDAEADGEVQAIHQGDTIDLAHLPIPKFSIVAKTEPAAVGSVALNLNGPIIHKHIENYVPYALFGDKPAGDFSGRLLPPGAYTLTATPYEQKNKEGRAGTPLSISFTIINSAEIEDSQVIGFDLYDAVTDKKIMDLTDGSIIHTDELDHDELTVLMHTVPDFVGSVKVELWGPVILTRIENTKPYALFRNNSKDLFGEVLPAGEYTLKATPYAQANAQGQAGEPLQVSFTVVRGDSNARLTAYPVPTTGVVNIHYQGSAEQAQMMLLDFTGQSLLTLPLQEQAQLDLSTFRKGIYYLKIVDQQVVHLKRVVVE